MRAHFLLLLAALALMARGLYADETLYRYEGDYHPLHPASGWWPGSSCEYPCWETVQNEHFVIYWPIPADSVWYIYTITAPPQEPLQSLWVEWRFRSNLSRGSGFNCDAGFDVDYRDVYIPLDMFGDAAGKLGAGSWITGLDIDEFHTYRFESVDGEHFWVSVDGLVFVEEAGTGTGPGDRVTFYGHGGCFGDHDVLNEWDMVRFGTLSSGEQIVASDPPAGFVDARLYPTLDRFAVTFDEANYVYIDDISVTVIDAPGGTPVPAVIQTRRRENDEPDKVEIVLDQPIPLGERTRFTFNDGVAVNVIEYEYAPGDTDGDGDADLADFAALANCLAAPDLPAPCPVLDADGSGTIDLTDYASWRLVLGGPVP